MIADRAFWRRKGNYAVSVKSIMPLASPAMRLFMPTILPLHAYT